MENKRQKSVLFRGVVILVAFAMMLLFFPVNILSVFADDSSYLSDEEWTYITIDSIGEDSRTVTKGATYTVPNALIGGSTSWIIGDTTIEGTYMDEDESVILVSSSVDVTYNGVVVTTEGNVTEDGLTFEASKQGTYTITYTYTYSIDGEEYTNTYSIEVESELSSASINFSDNDENIMPSILDLSLAVDGDSYKDLYLQFPTVYDEDGDEVEDVKFYTSKPTGEDATGNYVVVTLIGGVNAEKLEISTDTDDDDNITALYVDGDVFGTAGAGNYVFTYSYYVDGNFITSTTKSVVVYAADNPYYTDYSLVIELSSDWTDSAQTGIESTLPSAVGVTSSSTTPASESVDVYYKVQVLYTSSKTESGYAELDPAIYNTDDENPVLYYDEDDGCYYLVDPTSFTPLEDGYYRFIYTITDFYGNTKSTTAGAYEFTNVQDSTSPTPIIYDASVVDKDNNPTYEDASYKLATRAYSNAVVIYAIGMEDNVSSVGDEGVELKRTIMTDDTETVLEIDGYDAYNLVFNYRSTGSTDGDSAYANLLANNYLIYRAIRDAKTDIDSDNDMLDWLKSNNYLIVIDNANADVIYELFKGYSIFDSSINNGDTLVAWLQEQTEETIAGLGFAYIDTDATFGARVADSGTGTGQYYIHYIAVDAAGNESDTYRAMRIVTEVDDEAPEITFSTTLQSVYRPSATITFNVPTASDNVDNYMLVETYYRYLDSDGKPVTVSDKNDVDISTYTLEQLLNDINDSDTAYTNNMTLAEYYSAYFDDGQTGDGAVNIGSGYIRLTDDSASTYSIDLSEAGESAVSLQIVVYVYDDSGNIGMYAQTIQITNSNDQYVPTLVSVEDVETSYAQGEEVTIPTITVADDAVAYMSFNINVTFTDDDGSSISITPYGYYSSNSVSSNGSGKYYVHGGSFVASYSGGTYQVSISVSDSKGNTIVVFVNYEVSSRIIIQAPTISSTLDKTQTLELDDYSLTDTIEIPVPTVTYQIDDSVTYDQKDDSSATFVVYGVDADGKVYDYSTTFGQYGSLSPRQLGVGEYDIIYTVTLKVYNQDYFTYVEDSYEGGVYTEGGYFTYSYGGTSGNKITILENGGYKIEFTGSSNVFYILNTESTDGSAHIYKISEEGKYVLVESGSADLTGTFLEDMDLELDEWFDNLKEYTLTSDTYVIIIQDTTGPTITEMEYPTAIDKDELSKSQEITVYGIEATDASGINVSKSSVSISVSYSSGTSASQTWSGEDAFEDQTYSVTTSNSDGTYTITYTVYDNEGNYNTKTYTFTVGDVTEPTITLAEDMIADSYEVGSTLTIDLEDLTITDNKALPDNFEYNDTYITITIVNSSTSEELEEDEASTETVKIYSLDEVGTYTVTITVDDAVGLTGTATASFEVASKTSDTSQIYQVIGIVLIVVSVLVLVGVVVYFIVSKVKLDKELKK